jgi:hypothetical protein
LSFVGIVQAVLPDDLSFNGAKMPRTQREKKNLIELGVADLISVTRAKVVPVAERAPGNIVDKQTNPATERG